MGSADLDQLQKNRALIKQTMNRKRLAVILSNYNHGRYLPESLDSLLRQTRKADEMVIIDDASTDNSVELVTGYAARHPEIKLICNEQNRGYLYNARNALDMIQSEYFFAASADDIYLPDFFRNSMTLLETYTEAGLCSALSLVLKQDRGKPVLFPSPVITMTPSYLNPDQAAHGLMKYGSWFMGNTAIYNTQVYRELGGYDQIMDLSSYADGLIMEIIAFKTGACFIPEPAAIWRRTGKGWSDSIVDNMDTSDAIILQTRTLMRERFRKFIPDDYPELWERDFRFSLEKKMMRSRYNSRRISGNDITFINKYIQGMQYFLDYLYLLISHRSIRIIRRYINTAVFSVYYRFRNLKSL